ncbi:hypothetical protein niasHT_015303 [Heterodera trifolii]|uniref:26S proteasome non-ATPase regulatory subunit 1 n=1 Tax=Heterodera trifolii TaxID=157864 RepID=A0ABD2KZN9_9BILA
MADQLMLSFKQKIIAGKYATAEPFLAKLGIQTTSEEEKRFITENLDDWRVITATWFEMARHIGTMQNLATVDGFAGRHKASLLCSKIHYCREQYNLALEYALSSGNEFKLVPCGEDFKGHDTLYVNMIIRQALDTYKDVQLSRGTVPSGLEDFVNRIFNQNLELKEYSLVVGFALDTRRIDMIERTVNAVSKDGGSTTTILMDTLNKLYESHLDVEFHDQVLGLIIRFLEGQKEPNYFALSQCLVELKKAQSVAELLDRLLVQNNALMAYQLAFDLYENAPQEFLNQMKSHLFPSSPSTEEPKTETKTPDKEKLERILSGVETIKHHMQFLIKNNHTDMLILRQLKDASRVNCTHNSVVIANGLMHCGTTCDDFLRENLDWISKATNWNKFNAVASLGLIHKGHERDAKKLLEPYLPKGEQDQFGFKEGGSLFAYGLIHANHGSSAIDYLSDQLSRASTSAVRHGACLGLGLAALGTRNERVYEHLRDVLYQNEAVSGEAAGTAMGLVMAGSMNQMAFDEMYQYILDTHHDKIQRGLRTGISMLAYGVAERAEDWIRLLYNSPYAIIRQTGVCMIALAYAGTGSASVIKRLLERVASDPNDEVKRFATIAIGFVLSNNPQQCLDYVELLTEHFNGHIRYGAAIALAISCAGTGYKEAIALLEPLLQAKENYVRQGALVSLAFVLIQQTTSTCPKVADFRKTLIKMVGEKGEDTITKFGAVVAQGILDAGGRNVTLSLHNQSNQNDMPSVLGIFVFLQHWHWHSMTHFISLALRPTCVIALNKDLKMPKMDFRCNAKQSMFAYPQPIEEKRKEGMEKVETAVLSTTKKKPTLEKKAEDAGGKAEEKMEVDQKSEEKPKEVPEPSFHTLSNPSRVVRLQLRALTMPDDSPYKPMKPINHGGITMFQNTDPNKADEIVELAVAGGMVAEGPKETEPVKPHDSFEFNFGSY